MDRETWWATVHGVTKSWMRLNSHAQGSEKVLFGLMTFLSKAAC